MSSNFERARMVGSNFDRVRIVVAGDAGVDSMYTWSLYRSLRAVGKVRNAKCGKGYNFPLADPR